MQQTEFAINVGSETAIGINTTGLTSHAKAMLESIARRAYQIYEDQGRQHGHDREHWLQAEAELFSLPPVEVEESQDGLTVLAQVSGFAPRDLEIDLEPRRVTIIGKHQTAVARQDKEDTHDMQSSRQLLRRLDLPVDIDLHYVSAQFKEGLLELDVKKALAARESKSTTVPAGHTV